MTRDQIKRGTALLQRIEQLEQKKAIISRPDTSFQIQVHSLSRDIIHEPNDAWEEEIRKRWLETINRELEDLNEKLHCL